MKTITIILTVFFLAAVIFFGVFIIRQVLPGRQAAETEPTAAETDPTAAETVNGTSPDTAEETAGEPDENINKIEIYVGGNKNDGIFLGEAIYGLKSEDAALIYGQDFSNFGFELSADIREYNFEPGMVYPLYIYTYIPASGWNFARKEITAPGGSEVSETIHISLERPDPAKIIEGDAVKEIYVKGWAVDLAYTDDTGIDRVEVYLEGPKDFGKFMGRAEYGMERTDVGNAYGNANYNNSGFLLKIDESGLEPGINYLVYVYYYSKNGQFKYSMTGFTIAGEGQPQNALVHSEAGFSNKSLDISGWAINKKFVEEGVPRSLDIEYSIKKIVFVSSQMGNKDIFSMNLDGSEVTQLTSDSNNDMYPTISPDGKKIAYSVEIGNTWQIFTMNWDGSGKKQITDIPSRCGFPSWSFDGRHIYFEIYVDDSWEIYVMEADGSNLKRLTSSPGVHSWHPSSHPFINKTLYEYGHSGNEEIWQIDINGDNNERISETGRNYRVPKYSIDGSKIAFMGNDSNGREQIFIMDSNGKNIQQLTDMPDQARLPSFSPDNKYIAFNTKTGASEIFIMNIDGSDKKQLTDFPGIAEVAVFMYQAAN